MGGGDANGFGPERGLQEMKNRFPLQAALVVALGLGSFGLAVGAAGSEIDSAAPTVGAPNKYIGAGKCKNCHAAEETGDQHAAWEKAAHSKAFATLATDAAKAIAKDKGIEDPQTADACVKCHTTAFGVEKKLIKKSFKPADGVQCESCHGPGDQHFKARFAAAAAEEENPKIDPKEIITKPDQKACLACHNQESPTFKSFCYYERLEKIRHSRPRTDAEKAAELVCGCGEECGCVREVPRRRVRGAAELAEEIAERNVVSGSFASAVQVRAVERQ